MASIKRIENLKELFEPQILRNRKSGISDDDMILFYMDNFIVNLDSNPRELGMRILKIGLTNLYTLDYPYYIHPVSGFPSFMSQRVYDILYGS